MKGDKRGYIFLIIAFFGRALGRVDKAYRKHAKGEKYRMFWLLQPFITPLIVTVSIILTVMLDRDFFTMGVLIMILIELVFHFIKNVFSKGFIITVVEG